MVDFTSLGDIIEPELFTANTVEKLGTETNAFLNSPIVAGANLMPIVGTTTTFRYLRPAEGDAEVVDDNTTLTDQKMASASEQNVVRERATAFTDGDLASLRTGTSLAAVAESAVVEYWGVQYSKDLRDMLKGLVEPTTTVSGATVMRPYTVDFTGATDKTLSVANWIKAKKKLGDQQNKFTHLLINGTTYADLEAANEIDFSRPSEGGPIATWRGLTLVVDDEVVPVVDDKAYSIAFRPGAVMFQLGSDIPNSWASTGIERIENKGAGITRLVTRRRWSAHVKGVTYVGASTMNAVTPSGLVIADSENWAPMYDSAKKFNMLAIKHTVSA